MILTEGSEGSVGGVSRRTFQSGWQASDSEDDAMMDTAPPIPSRNHNLGPYVGL